jgi:hypothetical protein
MRIIAAILSVYILVLSGIACEDHHHDNAVAGSVSVEISADMHNHSDADICNPFFFCHAGHHTFVGEEIHLSQLKADYFLLIEIYSTDYHFAVFNPIWNPPKL